jgi:hypothetical protein
MKGAWRKEVMTSALKVGVEEEKRSRRRSEGR